MSRNSSAYRVYASKTGSLEELSFAGASFILQNRRYRPAVAPDHPLTVGSERGLASGDAGEQAAIVARRHEPQERLRRRSVCNAMSCTHKSCHAAIAAGAAKCPQLGAQQESLILDGSGSNRIISSAPMDDRGNTVRSENPEKGNGETRA